MPLNHESKVYGVVDCKIAKLTADPASGSPTYATSINVPGIKTVAITGTVDTKQLRGDNQLLDQNSTLTNLSIAISNAKISLDAIPVLTGGTTTDSGTTPNQVATFVRLGSDVFSYWKLEAATPVGGADPTLGDLHFVIHKLMISDWPAMGNAEEDYQIMSFNAVASPLVSNGKLLSVVLNETAVAIT